MNQTSTSYQNYKKPSWAPPAWLFAPVWTVLYMLIIVSFGYVALQYFDGTIGFTVALPFLLNIIFNLLYTPLQFKWSRMLLATLDVYLVLATLLWALVSVYPLYHWVVWINIPYLLWVTFACILQTAVFVLNKSSV